VGYDRALKGSHGVAVADFDRLQNTVVELLSLFSQMATKPEGPDGVRGS
jgi:hypothetical protein